MSGHTATRASRPPTRPNGRGPTSSGRMFGESTMRTATVIWCVPVLQWRPTRTDPMAILHFHGHATFTLVTDDGTRLVVDPWFTGNPVADQTREQIKADYVLCTHGHSDHFTDAIPLARETGATLISTFEIVSFVQTKGVEAAHPMHIGGG